MTIMGAGREDSRKAGIAREEYLTGYIISIN